MNKKALILFAHPRFERSADNSVLLKYISDLKGVTIHDLYEKYPDFNINVEYEKKLLSEYQIIVWQHPFYWYSSPPLLKQWIDLVLQFGWAYGPGGNALEGKIVFNAITTGGQRTSYSKEGHNRFTVKELLAPFDQTATLCKMKYLPPFVVHGTHKISEEDLHLKAKQYRFLLEKVLSEEINTPEIGKYSCLNDWIEVEQKR